MRRWWWAGLVVLIGLGIWWTNQRKTNEKLSTTSPEYVEYYNDRGKYELLIPYGWEISEATEEGEFINRVDFYPRVGTKLIGTAGKMTMTVVATESAEIPFSTEKEFEEWRAKTDETATISAIWKVKNEVVDNKPAVRLAEVVPLSEESGPNYWSMTTWVRDNGVNYYFSLLGNGTGDMREEALFSWLVSKLETGR